MTTYDNQLFPFRFSPKCCACPVARKSSIFGPWQHHCLKHFHLQKSSVLLPGNAWGEGRLFWSLTHVCHGGQDGGPTKRGRWPSNQWGKGCQRDLILAGQRGWCILLAEYGIISGWSHGKRVVWCGDWVALESTKIELTDGEQFHDAVHGYSTFPDKLSQKEGFLARIPEIS